MTASRPLKVYVSAASRGLAFAIGRRLAQDGAHIALSSRNQKRLELARDHILRESPQSSILTIKGDLSIADDQERVFEVLEQKEFSPDVFVCSAGQTAPSTVETVTRPEWQYGVDMILSQAVFGVQRFVPAMARRRFGRVIFLSSIIAKYPNIQYRDYVVSATTRAGLFALAKSVQGRYASEGVAAFTIALGYVDTPLLRNLALGLPGDADAPEPTPDGEQPWRRRYDEWSNEFIPAKRIGSPQELAEVVAFLISPAADYLNGAVLPFAGGMDGGIV